ncbi:hypothetical protein ASC72_23210 [Flavobacterium sp. Root420]|nr:hypothetical protein ASC72_23210 [Flavobacterium sp. Root420]
MKNKIISQHYCWLNEYKNMKAKKTKMMLLFVFLGLTHLSSAQTGIGTTTPNAILEVKSEESGILIPRMTALQIEQISTPHESELVFSTSATGATVNQTGFWYYTGSLWAPLIAVSSTGQNIYNSDGALLADRTVTLDGKNLNFGAGKLFINGGNGNIGINTDQPTENLDVNGTMRIRNLVQGNVVTTAQGELSNDNGLVHKYGDIRFSYLSADHDGWYLLNGRAINTLPATAQTQAGLLGISGNLPNAAGLYIKQGTAGTITGAASVTLLRTNFPNITYTGTFTLFQSHTFTALGTNAVNTAPGNTWGMQLAGGSQAGSTNSNQTYTSSSNGAHSHTVTMPSGGSNTPFALNPSNIQFNYFIYLGK